MSTKVTTQVFSLANLGHSIMGFLSQREQALMSSTCRVFKTYYHFRSTITTSGVADFHEVVKYCSRKQEVALEGGNLEQIPLPPPTLAVKVFLARANTLRKMDLLKGTVFMTCIRETEFLTLFSEPNRFPALTELRFGNLEREMEPTPASLGPWRSRPRYFPSVLKEQDFAKVGRACPTLHTLFLHAFSTGLDSFLSTMPHLEDITFDRYNDDQDGDIISSATLVRLAALKSLKRTTLKSYEFNRLTAEMPALTALHLGGRINKAELRRIVGIRTLQDLRITGSDRLCNEDLSKLHQATNLRTLGIGNCYKIGDKCGCILPWSGLIDLGRAPPLTHFILGNSDAFERALYFLPTWPHLRELTIEDCSRKDDFSELERGVQALAQCKVLERVNITKFLGSSRKKLKGMMVALGRIPSLRVVKLEESNFTTGNVVTFLEAATGVQQLMLVRCKEVDGDRVRKVPTKVRITIDKS